MEVQTRLKKQIADTKRKFFALGKVKRLILCIILFALVGGGYFFWSKGKVQAPAYQTAQAEKGTLVVSVSASGAVATANNASITTKVTGVVKNVYVKNGQTVKMGTQIAQIDLDRDAYQNYLQALAAYQNAKSSLVSAQAKKYSLQASMFDVWDTYRQLATNSTYTNGDGTPNYTNRSLPEFHIAEKKWLAAEADFKNQEQVITAARTSLSSSAVAYQQLSPILYAPISGTISGLSLQPGTVLQGSSNSSNASTVTSSQKIANVQTDANPTVTINLSEIDAPKVTIGDRATVTLDAYSGKTFTGHVISVDTVGSSSSGVTTYPTVILLDTKDGLLPNMAASASIITQTKDDVLLVPSVSVQTQNGVSTVRVLKNKRIQTQEVELGSSSDTQTEITSGLSEGDVVVTSVIPTTNSSARGTQSPFSSFGVGGGIRTGGGGNVRFGGVGGR